MKLALPSLALLSALLASAPLARAAAPADLWAQNCAACHGADGAGHTRAGRMAGVKDFTDPKYQATFTDSQAAAQIAIGFTDASGKVRMKGFGDAISAPDILALVAYVRSFRK